MRKTVARLALVACLAVSGAASSIPATGSMAQRTVVKEDPSNLTPNVVDDRVVRHTSVDALAQLRDTIYAGGRFHRVQNAKRNRSYNRRNLMSFDATTGAMRRSFKPTFDGKVFALLANGKSLYVGGYFTSVNGVARRGLAKINAATGAVDRSFNAKLDGNVQEIRLVRGRLIVGGSFRQRLVALNPKTGGNTGFIKISISGTVAANAGFTDVYRFAVNPAGTRLVAIGNFTRVDGRPRSRAFMLRLGRRSATLAVWYYQPLANACQAKKTPAQLRDVDFSPNGRYFVMNATGYVPSQGGGGRDVCDATARFETGKARPKRPTWINYSGGDTFHSLAATGRAVYVQGHFRALNTWNGSIHPGPHSVRRKGIGALDPSTGKALKWNPHKTRGVGGKDFLVTPRGLWVASDGARFDGEYCNNIAFLPL